MRRRHLLVTSAVLGHWLRLGELVEQATDTLWDRSNVPLLNTEAVVKNGGGKDVEENVGPEDTEVPPSLAVIDVSASEELVTDAQLAVSAVRGSGGVLKVAGCRSQERSEVSLARLAGWWVED